ncbi:MAG: hypothetical protein V3W04_13735 [Gammaproteobacteria bacterium]
MTTNDTHTSLSILDDLINQLDCQDQDAMIMAGPWVEAAPMNLFVDPILDPYERAVFGALWALLKRVGGRTGGKMPDYTTIQRLTNIKSRNRVAKAIIILRLSRWLTLYDQKLNKPDPVQAPAQPGTDASHPEQTKQTPPTGRFNVKTHILNAEPLSIQDTLSIDPGYVRFVRYLLTDKREKIRLLAQTVLNDLEILIQRDNPLEPETECTKVLGRIKIEANLERNKIDRVYDLHSVDLEEEQSSDSEVESVKNDRVYDLHSVDLDPVNPDHNILLLRSSGSSSKKLLLPPQTPPSFVDVDNLVATLGWPEPEFFDEGTKLSIANTVLQLKPDNPQEIIDEVVGCMRSRQGGHDPINSPARYFRGTCKRIMANNGEITELARQEKRRRERQTQIQTQLAAQKAAKPPEKTEKPKTPTSRSSVDANCSRLRDAARGRTSCDD